MQKNHVFLILTVALLVFAAAGVFAQSADIVDNLLSQENARFGEAVYMIAVGSGLASESVSIADAVKIIKDKHWTGAFKNSTDPITLGEVSFITMKALKIHGGLMYTLFPSPRYAVRELAYLGFIEGEAHPGNKMKGDQVLEILSKAIAFKEGK